MTFLAGVLADVLDWIVSKFLSFIGEEIQIAEEDQAIKDQANADAQKAQNAQTPADASAAANSIAADTFKQ